MAKKRQKHIPNFVASKWIKEIKEHHDIPSSVRIQDFIRDALFASLPSFEERSGGVLILGYKIYIVFVRAILRVDWQQIEECDFHDCRIIVDPDSPYRISPLHGDNRRALVSVVGHLGDRLSNAFIKTFDV